MEKYFFLMDWKINIVKMSVIPIETYRFNTVSIKILMAFFAEIENLI